MFNKLTLIVFIGNITMVLRECYRKVDEKFVISTTYRGIICEHVIQCLPCGKCL